MSALELVINNDDAVMVHPPHITITQAMPAHLRELAATMQEEDRKEIMAFGITPEKALWRSYKNSIVRHAGLIDGKVAAVWGAGGSFMGEVGTPWLLTGTEVKKISPLKFARIYQKEVKEMLQIFPILENYVATSYHAAVRLLEMVGFGIDEPETIKGVSMRRFRMKGVKYGV